MDGDREELIRRLFELATDITQRAHEGASHGQAAHLSATELDAGATVLRTAAQDLSAIAETIVIVVRRSGTGSPGAR